ncbi:DUF1566 domain-containing protein [Rheinheimera baltica]|uniref:DUF1566 domain-containing protein n=1 Tax=Rheinheimera baltica TaxID=67576 RepID=A0ABT9I1R7_9GAMM|nr:DUF1566 domain-containing protein [Rheinheimera baltica]MDP5137331.1 DUF1566 domain-containing protein [Rheinheimera baltica]
MRLKDYIALWLLCSIYLTSLFGFTATAEPALIDNRYEIIEDGSVVRDVITGLEWQRCSVGQSWDGATCVGAAVRHTWANAAAMVLSGGFVLPNIDQLQSLVFCSNTGVYDPSGNNNTCIVPYVSPTLNSDVFPNTPAEMYWSSTSSNDSGTSARTVHFNFVGSSSSSKSGLNRVRLVRAAQFAVFNLAVKKQGDGGGSVSASQGNISCGDNCSSDFAEGTLLTLTATADEGSNFVGWSGCGSVSGGTFISGNQCTVTMNLSRLVTAEFAFTAIASAPILDAATEVTSSGFSANWSAVVGATGYRLDVATTSFLGNYVPGFENLDVGNVTAFNVTGLDSDTTYYFRVRAYNSINTGPTSATRSVATLQEIIHTVTAVAEQGGSISPLSRLVTEGQTTMFDVQPDEGYRVASISGCNGVLAGNTYTTAVITSDCTVTASFSLLDALIDNRYQIIEDGSVVRDAVTGLEWQRCSVGQSWSGSGCNGAASLHDWDQAAQLTAAGGFVLPEIRQLRSLVYCPNTGEYDSNGNNDRCGDPGSYTGPAINVGVFPDTEANWYWSATSIAAGSMDAWNIHFGLGEVFDYDKGRVNHVRLVRTGQPSAFFNLMVQKLGSGDGAINSSPVGITCGALCSAEFIQDAAVVLTAVAESGSSLAGWSGCGSVSANQCTVSMSQARTVVAVFQPQQALITVSLSDGGQLLDASVNEQGTQAVYELAANAGFRISRQMGGSCPVGQWLSSSRYETGVTQSSCTVHFSFTKARRRTLPVWLFTEQD